MPTDDTAQHDEDNLHPSPDDALEPRSDVFDPARDEEHLEQDNETPASPPADIDAQEEKPVNPPLPPEPEDDATGNAHDDADNGTAQKAA